MMPFALLLIGLCLIFIEFYLPGGIIGAIGGALVFAGMVVYAIDSQSLTATLLFFAISIILVIVSIRAALYVLPRVKLVYLQGDQSGYSASSFDQSAIGKIGTVISDLKPGGRIQVEGKEHQALSIDGYIAKGESIEVIRGEGESLIVKKKDK